MNRKQRRAAGKTAPPAAASAAFAAGVAHHRAGRLAEAEASYRRVAALVPDSADAHLDLGTVLLQQDKAEAAATALRRSITLRPDDPGAHFNLGAALRKLGRLAEAAAAYRRVIALQPGYAEAHSNLGNVLRDQGNAAEAEAAYRRAIALRPGYADAHANRGAALQDLGRFADAAAACQRAIALVPDHAPAHSNLGNALHSLGETAAAAAAYRAAIAIWPDYAAAHANLGNALRDLGQLEPAVAAYRRAIALQPDYAPAHANLGNALQDQGRLQDAVDSFRAALRIDPDYDAAHANLLMCLHYTPNVSNADLHAEARHFGQRLAARGAAFTHAGARDAAKRLRIGYVSADFRRHPVGYFLAPVLASHDHASVEVFCYANQLIDDDLTARLRAGADHWRSIAGLSDADAAALINADGIDILVDLAGHTANGRLTLFALRPAPVQVSWLGYFGTTGLPGIDFILADAGVVPPGDEAHFTESVWRLPGFYLCYAPHEIDVRPAPPPVLDNGFVTFGCFNNHAKTTPETVRAWADILRAVPASRLFLKNRSLADPATAAALSAAFAAHGIDSARLILEGHSPLADMLAAYRRIDIGLDPFPFGGGTTTAEALWMGVPVVTLRGACWVGRMSAGILTTIGRADLVAEGPADYVRLATTLAGDTVRLTALHADLRQMMETSPFCDGADFTRSLEAAYRGMWVAGS